jgi:hypothetical protein
MDCHGKRFDDCSDERGHPFWKSEETIYRQPSILRHRPILVEAVEAQSPANVRIASAAYVAMAAGNERISRN